ncbi:DeoR/GlpR family DNA-binding transcription regulator [Micromonospora sp. MS34]|uniref:DeoR/GlpR family DNA-binding transcription regulator n=1 Tax=Micromonospora sp. MS34 TaxID=3385971 RepID=UPI0039A2215B
MVECRATVRLLVAKPAADVQTLPTDVAKSTGCSIPFRLDPREVYVTKLGPFEYESAPQRRAQILEALRSTGFLSIADLSRDLGVSDMTVRRDLRRLAETAEVRLVRGGVSLRRDNGMDPAYDTRAGKNAEAKRAIGRHAATLAKAGDAIIVDSGSTAFEVARALPAEFSGSIVTHSVPVVALLLNRPGARVVGLGGDLMSASQAFVGPMTVAGARLIRARTYFLGAAAIDERGVYVATDIERPTKDALMEAADEVVLVVDSSKFQTSAPVRMCGLDRLSMVITDQEPPVAAARRLREADVSVHVAT